MTRYLSLFLAALMAVATPLAPAFAAHHKEGEASYDESMSAEKSDKAEMSAEEDAGDDAGEEDDGEEEDADAGEESEDGDE